jgi:hypothetical protein
MVRSITEAVDVFLDGDDGLVASSVRERSGPPLRLGTGELAGYKIESLCGASCQRRPGSLWRTQNSDQPNFDVRVRHVLLDIR